MLDSGDQVGDFVIVGRIGAGATGAVYRGRHRRTGRDAAIKVLRRDLSQDQAGTQRFFTETRATIAIGHPGIARILECDFDDSGRAYVAMEDLPGESLVACMARLGGSLRASGLWLPVARQVAAALAAAHARGIVHLDLGPDHIYLLEGDVPRVKVIGFGVAKLIHGNAYGTYQMRPGLESAPATYLSPEQCRGGGEVDRRADVYALGCVLFEMFAGWPPFVRSSSGEVLVAHMAEAAPRLAKLVPETPAAIDELVAAMLAKNPDARPQTMEQVLERLGTAGEGQVAGQGVGVASGAPVSVPAASASLADVPVAVAVASRPMPSAPLADVPTPAAPASVAPERAKPGPLFATQILPPELGGPPQMASPAAPGRFVAGGTQVMSNVADTLGGSATAVEGRERARGGSPAKPWVIPVAAGGAAVVVGLVVAIAWPSHRADTSADRSPRAGAGAASSSPPPSPSPPSESATEQPLRPAAPAAVAADPVVTVELTTRPPGAEVWAAGEGAPRGRTPLRIKLRRDGPALRATLRAEGYAPLTVALDPAEPAPATLVLSKNAAAPAHSADPHRTHHRHKAAEDSSEFKIVGD
jgi:hypothetical protein